MASIESTQEVNVVASITSSPDLGRELIVSTTDFLKASRMSVVVSGCYFRGHINLLDGTLSACASIETTINDTVVSRSSSVVKQVDLLGNLTTLAWVVGIGTQLPVPGSCAAGQSKTEETGDLHIG
jgi:hypothetical protein